MPYSTPASAVAGTVATAAFANTSYRDPIIALNQGYIGVSGQVAGDPLVAASGVLLERCVGSGKTMNFQDARLVRPELVDVGEPVTSVAISGGALVLDYQVAAVFATLMNSNVSSFVIQAPPANGKRGAVVLYLLGDGTPRTFTWGASVYWPGGIAPTLTSTAGKRDRFFLETFDAGAHWLASNGGQAFGF